MFGGSGVHFIFHFEHDGNKFHVIFGFPENKISFAARLADFIVFFKGCVLESNSPDPVKLIFAEHFQAFADHLGRLLCFKIFQLSYLFVF